ncbi:MAG: hypothetical protein AUF79_03865 [Crenarchaeota archaeon 13_1_20CM_2_51_8]|nr:MAG: hypothetical protein AUF79_03865 [Crenarchaeota archaeon 13_1_20CM_2_51_8]
MSPNTIPAATPCHKWRLIVQKILGSWIWPEFSRVSLEMITLFDRHSARPFIPHLFQKGNSNRVMMTALTSPARAAPRSIDETKSPYAE